MSHSTSHSTPEHVQNVSKISTTTTPIPTPEEIEAKKNDLKVHLTNLDEKEREILDELARLLADRETTLAALEKLNKAAIAQVPPPHSKPTAEGDVFDTIVVAPKTAAPKPPPNHLAVPDYLPTIVALPTGFVELRCDTRGANAYSSLKGEKTFLRGVKEFASHRRTRHQIPYDLAATVEMCVVRNITPAELRHIIKRGTKKHGIQRVLPSLQPSKRKRGAVEEESAEVVPLKERPKREIKRVRNELGVAKEE